jgi:hypothetical protein
VLATILINSGELRDGINETCRALDLVTAVGSQRVRDRLEPMERALARTPRQHLPGSRQASAHPPGAYREHSHLAPPPSRFTCSPLLRLDVFTS